MWGMVYTGDICFISTGLEHMFNVFPSHLSPQGSLAALPYYRLAGNSGCHFIWVFLTCGAL